MTSSRSKRRRQRAADVDMLRRFNELRRELLDARAKTIDWWLGGVATLLTLLLFAVAIAGYFTLDRFREIEAEARGNVEQTRKNVEQTRKYVETAQTLVAGIEAEVLGNLEQTRKHAETAQTFVTRIKEKYDAVTRVWEGLTVDPVQNNPDGASKTAETVRKDLTASPIDQTIVAAVLSQQEGNMKKAIEKWRAIANLDGIDKETGARAWFSIGYLLNRDERNDIETVIAAYDEAIRLKPDYVGAYNNRGIVKNDIGRHQEAIADYNEAISQMPNFFEAHYNRGNSKRHLGQLEKAIADYDHAVRLKPNHTAAYNNRGVVKIDLGRYDDAIVDFDHVIRLKPDHGAYNNRGFAKAMLNRHKEAVADYDKAIRLKSDYAEAYYNRGKVNIFLDRTNDAIRDFETVITLARDSGNESLMSDAERALRKLSKEQDP